MRKWRNLKSSNRCNGFRPKGAYQAKNRDTCCYFWGPFLRNGFWCEEFPKVATGVTVFALSQPELARNTIQVSTFERPSDFPPKGIQNHFLLFLGLLGKIWGVLESGHLYSVSGHSWPESAKTWYLLLLLRILPPKPVSEKRILKSSNILRTMRNIHFLSSKNRDTCCYFWEFFPQTSFWEKDPQK